MAFLKCKNVRIAGISSGVPSNIKVTDEDAVANSNYDVAAYIEATGVKERRLSDELTTSDLGLEAAEKLIADLNWEKSEIECLIFVSQTPDYIAPATACVLQDRLGLPKGCFALDISLGCSGWVYGLSTIASIIGSGGTIKKGLLIVGDAKPRSKFEKYDYLFGYAATVTALEYAEGEDNLAFELGTDGSKFEALYVPDGGSRNQVSPESFNDVLLDGEITNKLTPRMNGMDVFAFGISTPTKTIKKLASRLEMEVNDFDYCVLHQANKMMTDTIVKKLKLPAEKCPSSLHHFGNTSSATIPLTIVTELKNKIENNLTTLICCGFGVGLSYAAVAIKSKSIILSDLVEVEDPN